MSDDLPRLDRYLARRLLEKKQRLDRYPPLPPHLVQRLHDDLRILLTYHSNAIEGNTLTLRETQLVIAHGMTVGGHALREYLEASNHAAALDYLTTLIDRSELISRADILKLHSLVMDRILSDAGTWRTIPVSIRGTNFVPPPAAQVPRLMREWLDWVNGGAGQRYEPIMRAAIAHHGFEAVHPFEDGNGRCGRLLLNLMLMRAGYPPALLLREWHDGYLIALDAANTGNYRPLGNLIGRSVESVLDRYLEVCDQAAATAEYLPLPELAEGTHYRADYLAHLIRKGRLAGKKVNGKWHSTRAALAQYEADLAAGVAPRGRPPRSSASQG
jgi:Fic family protein